MTRSLLLLATAASLAACQQGADTDRAARAPTERAAPPAPQAAPAREASTPGPTNLIGPDGLGEARRGMTIGQLRAALPAGTVLGAAQPFMVDVAGLPVVRGADTLYHVLVVSGEPSGDDAPITLVATTNPSFRTAEGVGPGTTLGDAATALGAATLSYSINDESREYVSFARFPHADIRFRVDPGAADSGMAGVYATEDEYNQTTEYDRSARIWLVMVDLRPAAPQ